MERILAGSVALRVVHTAVPEDAHRLDALLDLGRADLLAEGAEQLRTLNVDAAMWACTSGSFVFGWDGAREQVEDLGKLLDAPASSTSFAFVEAARRLDVRRVGVAATYPRDVAGYFVEFLRRGGLDVVHLSVGDIVTADEVGGHGRDAVFDLVAEGDHPDAEAVLVPDTALRTVAWLDELENRAGKPVLTANQVSVWWGLRLAGDDTPRPGAGALFRRSR
ncbi:MAG: maleate cis-trans isomerase [Streptosporangiales bacterium]|nr:maleate cis-trans isomerase [Streptosporangiales bacterium]